MREALRQARRGVGRTSPNPAVGAVIVRDNRIIAKGYHKKAGAKHAEVDALEKITGKVRKTDSLYVTLEPCHHHGKTPPCTDAILKAGLKTVIIGMRDPNPNVAGGGSEYLAEKGVKIISGILEPDCRRLNESFIKFVSRRRPFVVAKSALTLDGWTATSTGHSHWITNEKSRQFVHRLRDSLDGVMVGVGTVIKDDPSLTTRLKAPRGRDPDRIIVDTNLRIPPNAKVLKGTPSAWTYLVAGENSSAGRKERLQRDGIEIIRCPVRHGRIDLNPLMDLLGTRGVTSLLVEGGATLLGSLIREKLIDKFFIFKAAKLLGGNDGVPMARGTGPKRMDESLRLKDIRVRRFGDDTLIRGYPDYA